MDPAGSGGDDGAATHLRGIVLMIVAFAIFSCLDAGAKYLTAGYPVSQIAFARYGIAFAYSVVFLVAAGALAHMRAHKLPLQILRSLLLLTATVLNILALRQLQLAEASAIMFSNPLWVCALSVPLLGERVGLRRWMAVIIGFLGVLIIVRPGLEGFQWAAVYSIGAALCSALYQLATRRVASYDSAETTLFYTAAVGAFVLTPVMPFTWVAPDALGWTIMIMIGVLGAVGHQCLIHAHRVAPAPVLAPFLYTQIILMTAIGYVVFGDVPDGWTIAGATIVIASGLYVFYREQQVKSRARRAP